MNSLFSDVCSTYILRNVELISEENLREWYELLPKSRLEKAMKYKFFKDRRTSVLVYLLLRIAMYENTGEIIIPELVTNVHGKPYIYPERDVFNLSHTSSAVMCSYGCRCGCDIQEQEAALGAAVKTVMTEDEAETVSDDIAEMLRIWTMKEAYGKYLGKGLSYKTGEVSFSEFSGKNGISEFNGLWLYSFAEENIAYCVISEKKPHIGILGFEEFSEKCLRLKEGMKNETIHCDV